jgi:phage major head subunit gpT-like protein
MLITPASIAAITTNFQTAFQNALGGARTQFQMFAMLVQSSTRAEVHAWLDEVDELREWIGPRQLENLAARAITIENKKYERTIAVKREDIEDDRLGVFVPRLEMLARAAALWPDKLVVDALIAGGSALCYDGQYFFDTDHPVDPENPDTGSGNIQSNLHTSTALTAANYKIVRAKAMVIKARNRVPMGILPNLLIVPPALEAAAKEIVQAQEISGTTNTMAGTADVLVIPRLSASSDTTWYLADSSRPVKPLFFQQRFAPELVSQTDPEAANVFELDEYRYGVRARGAAGYGLWQLIHKCTA